MGPSYTHTHTHSCISLHTHAHTHVDSPSPADTLGHMHTGAAHSPLHTDTPTPAPAPTCTHLHPPHLQHSASVSCLLPGKDSARRVQAAAAWSGAVRLGEGFRARSSTPPPHPPVFLIPSSFLSSTNIWSTYSLAGSALDAGCWILQQEWRQKCSWSLRSNT